MNKRKAMALVLTICLIAAGLAGCGGEEPEAAPAPKKPDKLSEKMLIVMVDGQQDMLPELPEGYQINTQETGEDVKKAILAGDQDLAIVSPADALELYEESGGGILTVSPVEIGGISILYFGADRGEQTPSFLSGRRIVTAEMGDPSQYVLDQCVREDNGYSVAYEKVDSYKEVADALKDYNTFALVTEPYASQIMKEDSNVKKLMDLDPFWAEKGHSEVPTWILVTGKWKTKENQNDMEVFIGDYQKAMDKEANKKSVFYGQSDRGVSIVREFFRELLALDKNAMGGQEPPAEMFYKIKFPT